MRWERLGHVGAAAFLCVLAACGGGSNGGSAPGDAQMAVKGPPAGGPPGLVGNDKACAAILGKGNGNLPAHVREACSGGGGGGGGEQPGAPALAPAGLAVTYATKAYAFTWTPLSMTGITRYELLEDRDGPGPLAPATVASSTGSAVTLQLGLLHELLNAEYSVRACNVSGCGPAGTAIRPDVVQAVGTFKAATPGAQERYGEAVAVSADASTLAIGVPAENNVLTSNPRTDVPQGAGAVYVYTRGSMGWVQQSYLHSSHPGSDARFGSTLALSADGGTLAVGSPTDPRQGIQAGSVDVFARSGTSWAHQAYLQPGNAGRLHQFGTALALSSDGNTLAVGAPTENNPAAGTLPPNPVGATSPVGAAYVFTRAGTTWTQQAHVQHPQPTLGDNFGRSVALSADGTTLAVGATNRKVGTVSSAGAVYVFQRGATAWTQQALLAAGTPGSGALFGLPVALSSDGNTLAVGASGESEGAAFGAGAAYVFTRSVAAWTQQARLVAHNPGTSDGFGVALSLSGDGTTLAVGSPNEDGSARWFGPTTGSADEAVLNAGAVYVFRLGGQGWTGTGYLKPGNENRNFALFGRALALSRDGSALLVGAPQESSAAPSGGAAYLF